MSTDEGRALLRTLATSSKLCNHIEQSITATLPTATRKKLVDLVDMHYFYPQDADSDEINRVLLSTHATRKWKLDRYGETDRYLRAARIIATGLALYERDGPTYERIEALGAGDGAWQKCRGQSEGFCRWFTDRITTLHNTEPVEDTPAPADDVPAPVQDEPAPSGGIPAMDLADVDPAMLKIWETLGIQSYMDAKLASMAPSLVAEVRKNIAIRRYVVANPNGSDIEIEGHTHKRYEDCLDVLTCSRQENRWLWLFGPAGTGKSFLGKQLAEGLRMPNGEPVRYASIASHVGMSPSEFFGWLLPTGNGGKFEYVGALFADYVENGGMFFIDEIANLPPDALTRVNGLLSNLETWLPKRMGNPHLKMSPSFWLAAADNTVGRGSTGGYVRNVISGETRTRFQFVRIGYDRDLERTLFGEDELWLETCWRLRDKVQENDIREEISARFINQGLDLRVTHGADKYPVERCIARLTEGWSNEDRRQVNVTGIDG